MRSHPRRLIDSSTRGRLRRVAEHLVEFGQVENHDELVWPALGVHLFACSDWLDAELALRHVKRQLVVLGAVCFIQRVEITGGEREREAKIRLYQDEIPFHQ